MFGNDFWLLGDAVQRHSGLNIPSDDSAVPQFDIFSWFWLMLINFWVMQCSVFQVWTLFLMIGGAQLDILMIFDAS